MKKLLSMLLLFTIFLLGSGAVSAGVDKSVKAPPGVEFISTVAMETQFVLQSPMCLNVQVWELIRLPQVDDWPAVGQIANLRKDALNSNINNKSICQEEFWLPPKTIDGAFKEYAKSKREKQYSEVGYSMAY